jgi:hypothetical protein
MRAAFQDIVARVMPFDLVIDEATADGQEARVSRTSVCGSWGAIAGNLRFFADRFGVPRAGIEGTQIPEHLIRRYARRGPPAVAFERRRKREGLYAAREVLYFGFVLERDTDPLPSPFPADLADGARAALRDAVLAGDTPHPDQSAVRRALERLGFYWRRSGGTLAAASTEAAAEHLARQLAQVTSWDQFIGTRLSLDVDATVPAPERARLEALPSSVHLYGDRVPVDYEVEQGVGVARLRLREGQARRLRERDLPPFDRPVRFTVIRGKREAVRADTLAELGRKLAGLTREERARIGRGGRRSRRR